MDLALTAVRALHFAAMIALFGEYVYAYAVSPEARPRPRFVAVAAGSLAIAVLTAAAWLAIEAAHMSGEPLARALSDGTVRIVLASTLFGHTWVVRAVLAVVLALSLLAMHGSRDRARMTLSPALPQGRGSTSHAGRTAQAIGAVCAALLLLSLASAGHAAGGAGSEGVAHLCADGVHLVAAGAWLGALVPLVCLLREESPASLARAVRRFSLLGMACMGALVLSGLVNAAFALQHLSELVTSRYGRELSVKLALFAAIVALAAVNRVRLAPGLESADARSASAARSSLLRNALAEVVLGFAIVAIVANLGITMPPMRAS